MFTFFLCWKVFRKVFEKYGNANISSFWNYCVAKPLLVTDHKIGHKVESVLEQSQNNQSMNQDRYELQQSLLLIH